MSANTLAAAWDDYVVELREDVHQLLAWSYGDNRTLLATARDEYEMTGLLADGMEARIDAESTPKRYSHYAVQNERPTGAHGQLGKRRPRLDIHIVRCGMRPRPDFTFEAKRLRDDRSATGNTTVRHYLGMDGIQRFLSGYYAPGRREAAMLGLIQAHTADFWFARIAVEFDADSQSGGANFSILEPLTLAIVNDGLPDERVSTHKTSAGYAIRLFHVFVDCR